MSSITGPMPMRTSASSDVFMPSAAMAVMIRKAEIWPTASRTAAGMTPSELSAASARKPNRKTGGVGRAEFCGPPLWATHQAMPAMAGSRAATLSSFVTTASLRTCGPIVWPAPATCATSWIAPPRNTPISNSEKPSTSRRGG